MNDECQKTRVRVEKDSKTFSTNLVSLTVSNNNFYEGKGSIKLIIKSKKTGAAIPLSIDDDIKVNIAKKILKPLKHSNGSILQTPTETFGISNKLTDTGYIVSISKRVITNCGRSSSSLSIELKREDLETIYDIISGYRTIAKRKK